MVYSLKKNKKRLKSYFLTHNIYLTRHPRSTNPLRNPLVLDVFWSRKGTETTLRNAESRQALFSDQSGRGLGVKRENVHVGQSEGEKSSLGEQILEDLQH